jgi:membrane fusion protein (multidrug efflux system)
MKPEPLVSPFAHPIGRLARALALAALIPLAAASCSQSHSGDGGRAEEDEEDEKGVPVELAAVETQPVSSFFTTTTTLEAEKEAEILAKISSQVISIPVEEGQEVEKGALLARLDDREWVLALEEAEIQTSNWKRELDRLNSIHEKNLISEKELEDARYQYQVYQNQAESARLKLSYTRITAPFAGVVTLRQVEVGDNVNPGTPLFQVADREPVEAKLYLPERLVASVRVGQEVVLVPDAAPDRLLRGRVARLAPVVDARTGTIKVTVELDHSLPEDVPLGAFVRARIRTDTHAEALVVPKQALVSELGETYVYVAKADTVRRGDVVLGYEDGDLVEVLEGLAAGDTIVVVGQGSLREGTRIRVISPEQEGADVDGDTLASTETPSGAQE